MGWFLSEPKLAKNRALPDWRRERVERAFEGVGVYREVVADSLQTLLLSADEDRF